MSFRSFPALAVMFLVAFPGFGQGVITTFAGTDWIFPGDGRPALQAPIGGLLSLDVAADRQGNYYVCDADNGIVMRVSPGGILNVVAGTGLIGRSGDGGFAANATLDNPQGVAVDNAGNIYISEYGDHVRKVTPDGIIHTIVGTGDRGYLGDGGPAIQARLNQPRGLAVDSAGNLYIADTGNNVIRKVTPDGTISTVAGNGRQGNTGDGGAATAASLNFPVRIAVDAAGNLFIAQLAIGPEEVPDIKNARVRKVSGGVITTVAGGGTSFDDGVPATQAGLLPAAVAVDGAGFLYIVDTGFQRVMRVDPAGKITTIAGGVKGFSGDGGPALKAAFSFLAPGIAVDASGVLVADDQNRRVRRVTLDGKVQTVAGNGLYRFSGDGGPATSATLYLPTSVRVDKSGNVFIAEGGQNLIRKVTPNGIISVYAGTGQEGYTGDGGAANQAQLAFPNFLTFGPDGGLYFSDTFNQAIRRIDASGKISTYLITGQTAFGPDAPGNDLPFGIDFDPAGEILIADWGANRLLYADATLTKGGPFAGTGTAGFSGDGGKSTAAMVNRPTGLAYFNGYVYFCDSGNNRVRRIALADLTINTVVGNGKAAYAGDGGPATSASLDTPEGLAFDSAGNMYIADQGNMVVRKVTPGGTISTFAGLPTAPLGDGRIATQAFIGSAYDISFDGAGNAFIVDEALSRVRQVLVNSPTFSISNPNLNFTAPAGSTPIVQTTSLVGSIPGLPYTVTIPSSAPWVSVSPSSGQMPASLQVTVDPSKVQAGNTQAAITITSSVALPTTQQLTVALSATAPGQPSLNIKPASVTFSYITGASASSRVLNVANVGGGNLNITSKTDSGWLTVLPPNVSVGPFGSKPVTIVADPSRLPAGTYSGSIVFSSANPPQSVTVPVTMIVSSSAQSLLIPQSGLTFFAVTGSGPTLPQFFNILNNGQGLMPWSVEASTLSGGSWLNATPANGSTNAASPLVPAVRLDVNPQGLNPGIYAGNVKVTAPQAPNSPQSVTVFLNVLPPGSTIGPIVQPAALVFTAVAAGESPGSQTVSVQSVSTTPIDYHSSAITVDGKPWLTVAPRDGTITAAQPARILLQPQIEGLAPGTYRALFTLSFSDGSTRSISILMVLVAAAPGSSAQMSLAQAQASCNATTLNPLFTLLPQGFAVPAAFPSQLAMKVIDDCGNPMTSGGVTVSFSNGDPSVRLDSLKDGSWAQTWIPQHGGGTVTVTADAELPDQNLKGEVQVKGNLLTFDAPPSIPDGGIGNAAGSAAGAPVAPGSLISIYGTKLANGPSFASSLPLPIILGGSSLVIAGVPAPLTYAADGQINGLVPYETAPNTTQQMIITHGSSYSPPQSITVAPAAPAIFIQDPNSKQGYVFGVDSSGAQNLADPSHPVKAGDAVIVYCTGLGTVTPAVTTGAPAPLSPLSNTDNKATVTIGGVDAPVFFSGLTPQFVGLYQVNAIVPQGVPTGSQVPLVLTAAGQVSPPVNIAVR